jgi:hypothetical protein
MSQELPVAHNQCVHRSCKCWNPCLCAYKVPCCFALVPSWYEGADRVRLLP